MRSYDLAELEALSGLSRRTISDYISRGLLTGPSHRGRGARYSQRDMDALRVIPVLRTVLKREFPNLAAVREFLGELSLSDLRQLARLTNERVFEIEVRRIRIRCQLKTFLPAVPPERVKEALSLLTPEQICGVDRGQYQIGSLLDVESLAIAADVSPLGNGNGNDHADGDDKWERLGTPTVQVQIEKRALGDDDADTRIPDTIRDFARRIESLLKTAS